jgi:hypothetical protein
MRRPLRFAACPRRRLARRPPEEDNSRQLVADSRDSRSAVRHLAIRLAQLSAIQDAGWTILT